MVIYDIDGKVILDVAVEDSSVAYESIKSDSTLTLKYSIAEHKEIPLGAYCVFEGETYYLMAPEDITMHHRRHFEYTLVMYTYDAIAKRYMFVNPVDGRLKFSLTATPREHLQMFVDNMNMRDGGWEIVECIEHDQIVLSYNQNNCLDALIQLANQLECDYWFDRKKVSLGKLEVNKYDPLPLSYGGDGNGLKAGTKRVNYSNAVPIEVLYVQGSDKNIDLGRYGSSELHLPKSQSIGYDGIHFEDEDGFDASSARWYKVDDRGISIRRSDKEQTTFSEDSLDCSEIYPTREETVDGIWHVDAEKHFFDIAFNSDIDYSKYQIAGETPTIIFQKGMLAGKEFDIATDQSGKILFYDEQGRWRMEIVPKDVDGIVMPDVATGYVPVDGDTFKFFGIQLPDEYICNNNTKSGAEWDMLRYAVKYLYANEDQQFTITAELDELYAKRNWSSIKDKIVLGGYVAFSDKSFQAEPVLIRITGIKRYVNKPYSPSIEISNTSISGTLIGTLNRIENQEVYNQEMFRQSIDFTKRRWRDAKETISMLEQAMLEGFTESISPITVKTMSLLVGDESLQFRFVNNKTNPSNAEPTVRYDKSSKNVVSSGDVIQHMTLGIDSMAPTHSVSEYRFWTVKAASDLTLDDSGKAYYLYIKANASDTNDAEYVVSTSAIGMTSVSGYYHFLTAVINSESDGDRSLSFLNGFTEVLPSQVTTEKLRDSSGNLVIDLSKATITAQNGARIIGDITFGSGSTGLGNIPEWNENVLKNLLQVEEEYVGQYNQYFYYNEELPFIVNEGEEYTINIEKLEIVSGTPLSSKYVAVIMPIGSSSPVSYYVSFTLGGGGSKTLQIKPGVINSSARLMIGKDGGCDAVAKITRMSLVKGTAPLTTWQENKDYLYNAFKNGNTKVSGGLVMTQAVMVEDGNGTIKGLLNGSSVAEDETYGKLILGAGINGASESDIKNAKVKIYDSGRIEVDNKATNGKLSITEDGIRLVGTGISATLGNCVGAAIQAVGVGGNNVCPNQSANVGLHATSSKNGAAIYCDQGQFWGLRPNSLWSGQGINLDFTNHTIFARGGTISLPSNNDFYLQIGQVYKIIHVETTSLTINTFGNVYELKGSSGAVQVDSITSTKAEVIDLYYGGVNWYFKRSNS